MYLFLHTLLNFFKGVIFFASCLFRYLYIQKNIDLNTNMLVPLQVNQLTFLREKILK